MSVTLSYVLAVDFGGVDECPATLSTFTLIREASVTWLKLTSKWGQPILIYCDWMWVCKCYIYFMKSCCDF